VREPGCSIQHFQSTFNYYFAIAILIAIKNLIRINHNLFLICKSDRDFSGKIDP